MNIIHINLSEAELLVRFFRQKLHYDPPSCVIDRVTHESSQLTFVPAISFATRHLLIAYIS